MQDCVCIVFPSGSALFQQDNAHCHTTNFVQERDKEFKMLTCPPNSLDLNLIEHVQDVQVGTRCLIGANLDCDLQ